MPKDTPAKPGEINGVPIAEVANAVDQLSVFVRRLEGVPKILAAIQGAEAVIQETAARKAAIEAEITQARARADRLQQQLEGKDQEVKAAMVKLDADLTARQTAGAAEIAQAEQRAQERKTELERTVTAAEKQVRETVGKLQAGAAAERRDLDTAIAEKKAELARVTAAVTDLRAQLEALRAGLNQVA